MLYQPSMNNIGTEEIYLLFGSFFHVDSWWLWFCFSHFLMALKLNWPLYKFSSINSSPLTNCNGHKGNSEMTLDLAIKLKPTSIYWLWLSCIYIHWWSEVTLLYWMTESSFKRYQMEYFFSGAISIFVFNQITLEHVKPFYSFSSHLKWNIYHLPPLVHSFTHIHTSYLHFIP